MKAAASFPRSCDIVGNPLLGFPQCHSSGSFHRVFASRFLPHRFYLISPLLKERGGIKKYSDISAAGLFSKWRL
jgi:hypothetical protein